MQNSILKSTFRMSGIAMILVACGNGSSKASATNFESVLNEYYAKHKECVGLPTTKNDDGFFYMAEIADDSKALGAQRNDRDLKPFLALAKAGIMTVDDVEVSLKTFSRVTKVPGKGFKLTDVGKSLLLADEFKRNFGKDEPQLCYGRRIVKKIDNFSELQDLRGVTVSSVKYSYTVGEVAEWAKLPEIYLRYPHMESYIAITSEDKDDLVLSNNGWVHFTEFE